ncbi:superoxide dismutase copper/zinc binding [Methylobacterium sp. 4-46]|uniref:superoxide dismutase family protein n=1 Tax=unclassified Methylobacterium TaxID=2615210 RepID=UPI000152C8CB|nr:MULTISPECIES: superoxide dismutase family protein [Methylobacterium]ACA16836.1 superoxide dismutase copper/zinc binding [Methylobacterium sp. 4-46]WFT82529.1 superoxide dismutase family protein [Methylobacterium nodulans]
MTRGILLAGTVALGAIGPAGAQQPQAPAVQVYEAPVVNNKGATIGKIQIRDGANALVLRLTIEPGGVSPGWHGIHFHAVANCSDTAKFELSKGHVNHESSKHGLLNPDGPDEGDLPNVFANADGSVNAEVSSETALTGEGGLKDADGSALVIHAGEDDHATQPIGNAGARLACAEIK